MFRTKLAGAVASGILLAAAGMSMAAPAHAGTMKMTSEGSGYQFRVGSDEYVNAWSGGPQVNVFTAPAENNDFSIQGSGSYVNLYASGGESTYFGDCISDYGNSSTDARAGLVPCSSSTPWGANLTVTSCTLSGGGTGDAFQDAHWPGGYLAPSGSGKGDAFYLNGSKTCFAAAGAY